MKVLAGTSGFAYPQWRGAFYPEALPESEYLRYYATRLPCVEINNTFYRMPKPEVLTRWCGEAPAPFRFVLKASRRISHQAKLVGDEAASSMRYLLDVVEASGMGTQLAALLLQAPPFLRASAGAVAGCLALCALCPAGVRLAFELPHPSWDGPVGAELDDELLALGHCRVVSDRDDRQLIWPRLGRWAYVRLRHEVYAPDSLAAILQALRSRALDEALVFFKHEDTRRWRGAGPGPYATGPAVARHGGPCRAWHYGRASRAQVCYRSTDMLTKPRRYQVRKEAAGAIVSGHPWIYRKHLSTAAAVFEDGQWLCLVGGQNQVLGYGIYEQTGAVGIRVFGLPGGGAPTLAALATQLDHAVAKRAALSEETNAMRLVAGEADGLPGVVIERVGDALVAQSYARGADALTRWAAGYLRRSLKLRQVYWRPARRRMAAVERVGALAPELAQLTEGAHQFVVDLSQGQKTGAYLDLRGLRRHVAQMPLANARVLNLFAYTGMLGPCAATAGAALVRHVDASAPALAHAQAHHAPAAPCVAEHIKADIFAWLASHAETYELVICDPPAMTSKMAQVPSVLASYRKLYRAAAPKVLPGGWLIAACCTGRVRRAQFKATVTSALGGEFRLVTELAPEVDHPVAFPEADYLKILVFQRTQPGQSSTSS